MLQNRVKSLPGTVLVILTEKKELNLELNKQQAYINVMVRCLQTFVPIGYIYTMQNVYNVPKSKSIVTSS